MQREICMLAKSCFVGVIVLAAASGCRTPGSRPDDMSASAHKATAESAERRAVEHRELYDPRAVAVRSVNRGYGPYSYGYGYGYGAYGYGYGYGDLYWDVDVYNPTRRHLTEALKEEKHAAAHRAAAAALERFEAAQCGAFPPKSRAASPLLGPVEDVEDVFGGVRLRFAQDVDMNAVVAHIRCHLAFARTRARIGMDGCPLYVAGVELVRPEQSRTVELSVGDSNALQELRRRAHALVGGDPPAAEGYP